MGEYIYASGILKFTDEKAAYEALLEEAKNYNGFSWTWLEDLEKTSNIYELLKKCGWDVMSQDYGETEYIFEKSGDEEVIFETLAPYLTDESYIEISGDYGQRRYTFKNGCSFYDEKCFEQDVKDIIIMRVKQLLTDNPEATPYRSGWNDALKRVLKLLES